MAKNGFRSAGITETIEDVRDMVEKLKTLSRKFDCKTCFSTNIRSNDMTRFSFLFKFAFFDYPFLPNTAQPDYSIINVILLFKISVIWFLFKEKK